MIRAEALWYTLSANRALEHPAQGGPVHDASVNAKTNDAACELVHHYENPVGSQGCRFASEQITTPQTVLRVAEKGEPGRTLRIRIWPVVSAQDPADYVFVDFNSESQGDLFGNARTAPAGISPLHGNHGVDEILSRPYRSRPMAASGRKQLLVLSFGEHGVKIQQGRGLHNNGRPEHPCAANEESTQAGDETVRAAEVRCSLATPIEDQELMFDQHGFGNDRTKSARSCQPHHSDDRMNEKD
jgi:hypothetical protein